MRISAILSSAGWVAIYFSKRALLLSAGRFLTGYGIGVLSLLAKAGNQKEFEDTLRKLRGDDADISHEAAEIQYYQQTLQCMPKDGMLDFFQIRYLHAVTIGVGLMFLQQFEGANEMGFYASETFVSAGHYSGKLGIIAFARLQVPS